MRTKKRKVLNGMAVGQFGWSACQYKIKRASGWIGIEKDLDSVTFTVCLKNEEGNIRVPAMQMPYEIYLESERLLAFAWSSRDRSGPARVAAVSKLLRHLRRARYGEATPFGVLLKKLFEKTNLEDV